MNRNRLIPSSKQANIFSKSPRFGKRSQLLILSLITVAGVFITGIVLATSQPADTGFESKIIDLPNLSAEMQSIPSKTILANKKQDMAVISAIDTTELPIVTTSTEKHNIELAAVEQQAIDSLQSSVKTNEQQATSKSTLNWQEVTVKSGDNLSVIFQGVGLSARDTYNIAQLGKDIKPLLNLKPGQVLQFGFDDLQDPKALQQLKLQLSPIKTLEVKLTADGYKTNLVTREVEKRQTHASGIIESSLFEAGIAAQLSDNLVMELAYVFGWDIDFALDLRQGDSFTVVYDEDYLEGNKIADGDILAAEFTNRGNTYRAVRYTDDKGSSHYFAPNGDSMRKTFNRTPVHFSRISSKFNPNRKHPILKTSRPHQGVDYAAATGTPILATGDGKVDYVGRKGGYGRTVILSHGGKYTTLYAHMSKFKKGVNRGSRVKQGDVIGYLGMSGLATGPHLHYEFRVNGVHRNPLTVALPKAEPLPRKYRDDFGQKSLPLLAQLNNLSKIRLALNEQ
ncbi:MAG: murein DD-endopeptidase MepM/ murein hydrolase activator NlpD [Methylophagaceae bacterium]|jgi:murein DD-endopeptidase MepM/ murein hydrolase activator NlpD